MSEDRCLVTGASGFIGGAIARSLLADGAEVHGVGASGRPGPAGITMHRCDLLAGDAVAALIGALRPTHLIHAAWDVTHGAYWTAPANLAWLAAGARLLQHFLAAGGHRAVGVGSCAEYAWTEEICVEGRSRTAPATSYGRCKLALCEAFEAAHLMGASTAWARLFFPYGPCDGAKRFLPSLVHALRAGQAFETTSGVQRRDFIHIDDVGRAIALLARSAATGPVNIASGEAVALRDIALEAARALGADPALLRFGAIELRAGEPLLLAGDVTRLHGGLGFVPQVPWRSGVAHFALGQTWPA